MSGDIEIAGDIEVAEQVARCSGSVGQGAVGVGPADVEIAPGKGKFPVGKGAGEMGARRGIGQFGERSGDGQRLPALRPEISLPVARALCARVIPRVAIDGDGGGDALSVNPRPLFSLIFRPSSITKRGWLRAALPEEQRDHSKGGESKKPWPHQRFAFDGSSGSFEDWRN